MVQKTHICSYSPTQLTPSWPFQQFWAQLIVDTPIKTLQATNVMNNRQHSPLFNDDSDNSDNELSQHNTFQDPTFSSNPAPSFHIEQSPSFHGTSHSNMSASLLQTSTTAISISTPSWSSSSLSSFSSPSPSSLSSSLSIKSSDQMDANEQNVPEPDHHSEVRTSSDDKSEDCCGLHEDVDDGGVPCWNYQVTWTFVSHGLVSHGSITWTISSYHVSIASYHLSSSQPIVTVR